MDATSKYSVGVLNGGGRAVEDTRDHDIIIDGRLLKPGERIYSLVDMADDTIEGDSKKDREIIVIDGRVYERVSRPDDTVYEHTDVVEKGSVDPVFDTGLNEEIMKRVAETAERIAKEMVPEIAERVIREEIDKLKK